MFNPETEYDVTTRNFQLKDFWEYPEDYVTRPPYQRKNVWSRSKKKALLDSLFRRYYVPRLVLREIRVDNDRTKMEVVDGQQRINTAQEFFDGMISLPDSLSDLHSDLPGMTYQDLGSDKRRFVDKHLVYEIDLIKNIDDPANPEHQMIAAEIFWRLQQGEDLNYMEEAHGRLSSLPRNFVVKYADDIAFDYDSYRPVDANPDKHRFFEVINRGNDRMQHLSLLARFLILEDASGPADINASAVKDFIEKGQVSDGVGNLEYENTGTATRTLSHMDAFYRIFKNDPMVKEGTGLKEFKTEYFIISSYLLLRHLREYYVITDEVEELFKKFVIAFHERWKRRKEGDTAILLFSDNRQQTDGEIALRQRIIRQLFFEFASSQGVEIAPKDSERAFSEADRIAVYRRDEGLCQLCLEEGRSEEEALVPWSEYETDHVLAHSKGGKTVQANAQVLCRMHNRKKGSKVNR